MSINGYHVYFQYENICTECIHQFGNEISGSLEFVPATGSFYRWNFECPHEDDHRGLNYYYGQSSGYEGVWTS